MWGARPPVCPKQRLPLAFPKQGRGVLGRCHFWTMCKKKTFYVYLLLFMRVQNIQGAFEMKISIWRKESKVQGDPKRLSLVICL